MKTSALSTFSFLLVLSWQRVQTLQCGEQEYINSEGLCTPCRQCPPGQEPDRVCGHGKGAGMECRACFPGTFSDSYGTEPCAIHSSCARLKRVYRIHGTATVNSQCGECLPGYYNLAEESAGTSECHPCTDAVEDTSRCSHLKSLGSRVPRSVGELKQDSVPPSNTTKHGKSEENTVEYVIFAVIPIFCLTGLLGILFCNFLSRKGYRCTSEKEADEEAGKTGNNYNFGPEDNNEDTIGVLVRLITEKRENAAALEELLKEHQSRELAANLFAADRLPALPALAPLPHLCRHAHHLHTVQTPEVGTCCTRCSQKKWPEVLLCPEVAAATAASLKPVKPVSKSSRPGEVTLLSIGRFRVAHIPEHKQNCAEEESQSNLGDQDSKDVPLSSSVEENSLLKSTPKPKWLKPSDTKLKNANGDVI
ncbi:tumor necrosis factor receptor superfamily member 19L [Protopterus annectens]|uniref:tumor necrosis factor receptor superfamily member 19L n=1 Tax=Protopterus annectens TaxID=7888 RepID=UPI001CF9388A|nr:tumor necrosis factor receptor superfamily member 19L [Protopterus annectens]